MRVRKEPVSALVLCPDFAWARGSQRVKVGQAWSPSTLLSVYTLHLFLRDRNSLLLFPQTGARKLRPGASWGQVIGAVERVKGDVTHNYSGLTRIQIGVFPRADSLQSLILNQALISYDPTCFL